MKSPVEMLDDSRKAKEAEAKEVKLKIDKRLAAFPVAMRRIWEIAEAGNIQAKAALAELLGML